jgi:hypothetical protein
VKVLAFDEARFGLINWHRRRYCPKGFRPPYVVKRSYKWTYLYAAVEPTTGESFWLYLPGMDDGDAWRYSSRNSPRPTPTTTYLSCSMVALPAIAPSRSSIPRTSASRCLRPTPRSWGSGGEMVSGVQARVVQQDV